MEECGKEVRIVVSEAEVQGNLQEGKFNSCTVYETVSHVISLLLALQAF